MRPKRFRRPLFQIADSDPKAHRRSEGQHGIRACRSRPLPQNTHKEHSTERRCQKSKNGLKKTEEIHSFQLRDSEREKDGNHGTNYGNDPSNVIGFLYGGPGAEPHLINIEREHRAQRIKCRGDGADQRGHQHGHDQPDQPVRKQFLHHRHVGFVGISKCGKENQANYAGQDE